MLKLIYYSLKALERTAVPERLIRCIFELKMLDINGLCPAQERLFSGTGVYTFAQGAGPGCRRAFWYVQTEKIEKLFTFTLTEDVLKEFEMICTHLLKQSVDREFKSAALIEHI